jgi:murein DD-endopeptidase MepM/ murein hydrolase activator NlpD
MGSRSRRPPAHAHPVTDAARRTAGGTLWAPPRPARRGRSRAVGAAAVTVALAFLAIAGRPGTSGGSPVAGTTRDPASTDPGAIAVAAADSQAGLARLADPFFERFDPDARLPRPPQRLTGYRWPLDHARITQGFGASPGGTFMVDGVGFHDGIDIASFCGAPIVAAHDGVVIAAGRLSDEGMGWIGDIAAWRARLAARNLWSALAISVVIDDGNGYRSVYMHFRSIVVKKGEVVRAGDFIGREGATGHATGCHLHYDVYSPEDPRRLHTDPAVVRATLLPAAEIARVDPIVVLPALSTAAITWGWGAHDAP